MKESEELHPPAWEVCLEQLCLLRNNCISHNITTSQLIIESERADRYFRPTMASLRLLDITWSGPGFPITSTLSELRRLLRLDFSKLFSAIGVVPERSLRILLRKHIFVHCAVQKVLKSIAHSSIFRLMRRCMHRVLKNIAVFVN